MARAGRLVEEAFVPPVAPISTLMVPTSMRPGEAGESGAADDAEMIKRERNIEGSRLGNGSLVVRRLGLFARWVLPQTRNLARREGDPLFFCLGTPDSQFFKYDDRNVQTQNMRAIQARAFWR